MQQDVRFFLVEKNFAGRGGHEHAEEYEGDAVQIDCERKNGFVNKGAGAQSNGRINEEDEGEFFPYRFGRGLQPHAPGAAASQIEGEKKAAERPRLRQRGIQDGRRGVVRSVHERNVFAKSSARRSSSAPP